jgi:hypothetical protein
MVAIGSAALFMLSTAYQASWGQGGLGQYGDDDDGLSTGEIAAISVGAVGGGYLLWLLAGDRDEDDDTTTEEEKKGAFVPGSSQPTAVRFAPQKGTLSAGEQTAFNLQVRQGGQWVNVGNDNRASVEVGGGMSRLDGAKNAFAVPMTAAAGKATAVGTYTLSNGKVLSTQTTVNIGG